jgi:hypothetical protein
VPNLELDLVPDRFLIRSSLSYCLVLCFVACWLCRKYPPDCPGSFYFTGRGARTAPSARGFLDERCREKLWFNTISSLVLVVIS